MPGANATATTPHSRLLVAARLVAGFVLLIVGAVLSLPGIPGPGIALILLGLLLLSKHFAWARRTLDWVRAKSAHARDQWAKRQRNSGTAKT